MQLAAEGGIVAEAKLGLPRDTAAWEKDLRQLEKYDDDLKGWWTTGEHLPTHDILALVPITRATKFVKRDEMSMHLPGIDWEDPGSGA